MAPLVADSPKQLLRQDYSGQIWRHEGTEDEDLLLAPVPLQGAQLIKRAPSLDRAPRDHQSPEDPL